MVDKLNEHHALISSVCDEWNRAEEVIKRAEQLVDGAVIPSINELRYAGRRLIEAMSNIADDRETEVIQDLLKEARFNCHRAQHDAIDTSFQAISIKIDSAIGKLSRTSVISAFPDFHKLKSTIQRVEAEIAESRKNRSKREAIYASLVKVEFKELLDLFQAFDANEDTMILLARAERKGRLLSYLFGWSGFLVGVLSIAFAIFK